MQESQFKQYLAVYKPKLKWYRRFVKRAAVSIIYRKGEDGGEVLMMLRADRKGDPWSGQMGFPGGRMESRDRHTLMTAQRETEEELGIPVAAYSPCVGRLSDLSAGGRHRKIKQLIISPYVFVQQEPFNIRINHEVKEAVWIPLKLFKDPQNRQYFSMNWQNKSLNLPYYMHDNYKIWGLSLMMIEELLKLLDDWPK